MEIIVRRETKEDYRRVEEITREAFGYTERIERGGIGCPYEHWMVNELRKRDGVLELSLVAVVDNEIVGHVICSKAKVKKDDNELPVLNLGPISVLPKYQKMGIGKALIKELISNAKKLGFGAFLFFGRPEYYPQFGFVEAETFGVSDSEGYNYPSFMGMELIPGYLDCVKGGRFIESDIYNDDLNRDAVLMFDKSFSEEKYMRRCYELAIGAGKKGYDTFGAILVYDGKILEEAENTADYKKRIFGHAEFNLVHKCANKYSDEILENAVLYTSCAPCERCLGAIASLGVHNVVCGVSYKEFCKLLPFDYQAVDREGLLKQLGIGMTLTESVLEDEGMHVFEWWGGEYRPLEEMIAEMDEVKRNQK